MGCGEGNTLQTIPLQNYAQSAMEVQKQTNEQAITKPSRKTYWVQPMGVREGFLEENCT